LCPLGVAVTRSAFLSVNIPLSMLLGCEHAHTSRVRVATTASVALYIVRALRDQNVTKALQTRSAHDRRCVSPADHSLAIPL
jgi:hypothetical protein